MGGTHLSGVGASPAAAAAGAAPNGLDCVPNTLEPNMLVGFGAASVAAFDAPAPVVAGSIGPVWKIFGFGALGPKVLPPLGWLSAFFARPGFTQLLLKLNPPAVPLEAPFEAAGAPNAPAAPLREIPCEL